MFTFPLSISLSADFHWDAHRMSFSYKFSIFTLTFTSSIVVFVCFWFEGLIFFLFLILWKHFGIMRVVIHSFIFLIYSIQNDFNIFVCVGMPIFPSCYFYSNREIISFYVSVFWYTHIISRDIVAKCAYILQFLLWTKTSTSSTAAAEATITTTIIMDHATENS